MRRHDFLIIWAILIAISSFFSPSYVQGAGTPPKEMRPVGSDVKSKPMSPPPLPDLIIVGALLHLDRQPFIAFSSLAREEAIIVPIRFRIQNRGEADAGRFQIAIMQQPITPAGPESIAMVEGDRYIGGLRPTSITTMEGVGLYDLRWNVVFPKRMTGQKVKIRAILDSNNEVRESPEGERNNSSSWLEVQLPPLELRKPPVEMKPKGAK